MCFDCGVCGLFYCAGDCDPHSTTKYRCYVDGCKACKLFWENPWGMKGWPLKEMYSQRRCKEHTVIGKDGPGFVPEQASELYKMAKYPWAYQPSFWSKK